MMLHDDEEDERAYHRSKAVSQEFFKLFLRDGRRFDLAFRDGHVAKGPTRPEETSERDVPPSDKAAESVAHFLLERSQSIVKRLTPEVVLELESSISSSALQIGLDELSQLCSNVLARCRSWLRGSDEQVSAIYVTAGIVAGKLQSQGGITEEVRRSRIDMLAGNVGRVLKEHNLEAHILDR